MKRDSVIILRPASGDLTAGETSNELLTLGYSKATIFFDFTKLTLPDADDEVDFYIQVSYDDVNFMDVEAIHFAMADDGTTPKRVAGISSVEHLAADTVVTPDDGALTDDMKIKASLGSKLRIKTTVTGATAPTYAYTAVVHLAE